MCVSAAIIAGASIIMSAAGAYSKIQGANANARMAAYENAVRTKQLNEKRGMERLAAIEKENIRSADFERTRSTQFAAIGASGVGEHISFFQGLDPEQRKAFFRDIRNVRLGMTATEASIADEIQVGAYGVRVARFNASLTKVGAVIDFAKAAMQAASFAGAFGTPGAGSAASGSLGSSSGGFAGGGDLSGTPYFGLGDTG